MTEVRRKYWYWRGPEINREFVICYDCGDPIGAGAPIYLIKFGALKDDWARIHRSCGDVYWRDDQETLDRIAAVNPDQGEPVESESVTVLSKPPVVARPKIEIVPEDRLPYRVLDEFGNVVYSTSNLTKAKGVREYRDSLSGEDHNQ